MKEIQGKLILVQVSMRFKLARVRVIWSQLYYVIFLNCTTHLLFIYSHGMISSAIYYNGMFDLITLQIQELFIGGGGEDPNLGSERTVELFCGNYSSHTHPTPLPPVVVAHYTDVILWPLTVHLNTTHETFRFHKMQHPFR